MHPAAGVQSESDRDAQCQGDEVGEHGRAQQPPTQPGRVDLESGEEQQESQADEAEDLHRQIDLHPAENRGSEGRRAGAA